MMKTADSSTGPRAGTPFASLPERAFRATAQALEQALAWCAIAAFRVLLWLAYSWRIEVRNPEAILDNLERPALLVANHTSHLDFILLNALFKKRFGSSVTFLAKKELWESPIWRLLIRYGNAIPVDRAQFGMSSLRAMKGVLADRRMLGLFPEGTRSADGQMGPIKPGLEFLARLHPDLLFVPCGLQGLHQAWPKDRSLRVFLPLRHRLVISFGTPRCYRPGQAPADFARELMTEVAHQAGQGAPSFEPTEAAPRSERTRTS